MEYYPESSCYLCNKLIVQTNEILTEETAQVLFLFNPTEIVVEISP